MKLDVNSNIISRNLTNTWKLNNAHVNHQWVKDEIKRKIKDFLKLNENYDTTYPNLWDTMIAVLRENFIALNAYVHKLEKAHTSKLTEHWKTLKEEEANS